MSSNDRPSEGKLPVGKLAAPARRALTGAGISQLSDLTRFTESEVGRLHGIGPNAMQALRVALEGQGLSFAADTTGKHAGGY